MGPRRVRGSGGEYTERDVPEFFEDCFKLCLDPEAESQTILDPVGLQNFCTKICLEPVDREILVFLHACRPQKMGYLSHSEFFQGLSHCRDLKLPGWKAKDAEQMFEYIKERCVMHWHESLLDAHNVAPIYEFVFQFALAEGETRLPISLALDYWDLLLDPLSSELAGIEEWIRFMSEKRDALKLEEAAAEKEAAAAEPAAAEPAASEPAAAEPAAAEPAAAEAAAAEAAAAQAPAAAGSSKAAGTSTDGATGAPSTESGAKSGTDSGAKAGAAGAKAGAAGAKAGAAGAKAGAAGGSAQPQVKRRREEESLAVSKDLWRSVFQFFRTSRGDIKFLKKIDLASSAWPNAIDEFVEWYRAEEVKKAKQKAKEAQAKKKEASGTKETKE